MPELYVFEGIAAACAMTGSALVTSNQAIRRLYGFVLFIISSLVAGPVMWFSGMMIYSMLQVFYLATSFLGFYNCYKEVYRVKRKEII